MKIIDAYILARTKRKTRRIRTALVVIVSSLLFAVLFGVAFVAQGIIHSGRQVSEVGFNSRNLTLVSKVDNFGYFDYPAESKAVEDAMIAELKARKVKVNDLTKQDPSFQTELNNRINKRSAEGQAQIQKKTEQQLHTIANPSAIYHFASLPVAEFAEYQPDPNVDPFVESLKKELAAGGSIQGYSGPNSNKLEFYSVEAGMMRTQVQPGQTLGWQPGEPYPLIVSYGYLEKLANTSLTNLPAAKRNAGYRDLIQRYAGQELPYCYRNATAQEQLRLVMRYNKAAEADKDPKTKALAVPICGGFDQKLLKKLQIISDADPTGAKPLFPPPVIPPPDTAIIKFKIAGFVPAMPEFGSADVISNMLVGISSLPTGPSPGIIPTEVLAKDQRLQAAAGTGSSQVQFLNSALFVDFTTKAEQKVLLDKGCSGADCLGRDTFYVVPFGNITTTLESFFKFITKALLIAAIVIMVIAGLMIMLTISKVIADSTKEIAVFRSLGARRRDIAQIYYTYGTMLAGSALLCSLILAVVGAIAATATFDDRIAQGFIQATGAYNSEVKVVLLGVNPKWLLGIVGALFIASIVGITIPVWASVRRKLINTLREE